TRTAAAKERRRVAIRSRRGASRRRARRRAPRRSRRGVSSFPGERSRGTQMSRSIKKGPFVDQHLIAKAAMAREGGGNRVVKTWSRRSTILPDFIGITFAVHNGKKFVPVYVTENM